MTRWTILCGTIQLTMASKLTPKRASRIREIGDMLLKSFTVDQIEQGLERRGFATTSRAILLSDIRIVQSQWNYRRNLAFDRRVDQELRVLEVIRANALEAYERSTEGTTTREITEENESDPAVVVPAPNGTPPVGTNISDMMATLLDGGGVARAKSKTVTKTKHVSSSGDPRFLDTAISVSKDIRTLLGVDPVAVKKIELVTRTAGPVTVDELRKMDTPELARVLTDALAELAGP